MIGKKRREARYRRALSTAICENKYAIFRALLHTDRNRGDVQLAEFLLAEAQWDVDDFMTAVIHGDV